MIVAGCGGVGFSMALNYKREISALRQMVRALDYLYCELESRLTPLPQACRLVSEICNTGVKKLFQDLAMELESQVAPDAQCCVRRAVSGNTHVPGITAEMFSRLGDTLGIFNLEGQLRGLQSVQRECVMKMEELEANRNQRVSSYQTLGLCAGAALAILFV